MQVEDTSLLFKKVWSKYCLVVGYVAVQLNNALFTFFSLGKQECCFHIWLLCTSMQLLLMLVWWLFYFTFNFDEPRLNLYCINIWTYCIKMMTLIVYYIFPLLLSLAGAVFPLSCKILLPYLYMFCFLFMYWYNFKCCHMGLWNTIFFISLILQSYTAP